MDEFGLKKAMNASNKSLRERLEMLVYQDEDFMPKDLYAMIFIYAIIMLGYLMKIAYRCFVNIQINNSL